MTNTEQATSHSHERWVAIAVFSEPSSLIAALKALVAIGVGVSDMCLVGALNAIRELTKYTNGSDLTPLRVLLKGMAETSMGTSDLTMLASRSRLSEAIAVATLDIPGKVRNQIIDGAIMLAVLAGSAAELPAVGHALLCHSSHHVHTFGFPQAEVMPT